MEPQEQTQQDRPPQRPPAPRGRRAQRVPRAVRERQMLDAAVSVFARRGYRSTSMDEIAIAAGVSKPLVYLYLKSKDELFAACVRREAEALSAAVRAAVETGAAPDRQLWSGLLGFFGHTSQHPDGWTLLYGQARSGGGGSAEMVAAMRAEIVDFVTALIASAARDARCDAAPAEREVRGLALALVGAAESLAGYSSSGRESAAALMNFAWAGLGNLLSGHPWCP